MGRQELVTEIVSQYIALHVKCCITARFNIKMLLNGAVIKIQWNNIQ